MGAVKRIERKTTHKKIKTDQWFKSKIHTGWSKTYSATKRRGLVLKAHKKDVLASARSMQALANVTADQETKKLAHADAVYFYTLHNKGK